VPEKSVKHEIAYFWNFLVCEDENAIRWPLTHMSL
jgi:hypothetical protein